MAEEPKSVVPDQTQNNQANQQPPAEEKKEEVDYSKMLVEKDEKISKLTKERDDFHKGMTLWQNRARDNQGISTADTETDDEKIARIAEQKAKEILLASELAKANAEKDDLIKRMATENSELKLALKNKPTTVTSQGSNQDKPEVNKEFFSKEQLEELKRRFPNADPNRVIENMRKLEDNKR